VCGGNIIQHLNNRNPMNMGYGRLQISRKHAQLWIQRNWLASSHCRGGYPLTRFCVNMTGGVASPFLPLGVGLFLNLPLPSFNPGPLPDWGYPLVFLRTEALPVDRIDSPPLHFVATHSRHVARGRVFSVQVDFYPVHRVVQLLRLQVTVNLRDFRRRMP